MPASIQGVEQFIGSLTSAEELSEVISESENIKLACVQVFAIKLYEYQWGIKAQSS
jgi:hypothetical protein